MHLKSDVNGHAQQVLFSRKLEKEVDPQIALNNWRVATHDLEIHLRDYLTTELDLIAIQL